MFLDILELRAKYKNSSLDKTDCIVVFHIPEKVADNVHLKTFKKIKPKSNKKLKLSTIFG